MRKLQSLPKSGTPKRHAQGFTLIELMVVIAIIGLLAAALLPNIVGAQSAANRAAVEANLKWHFESLLASKTKRRKFPSQTGVQFVVATWVQKDVERTEQNYERYWIPGIEDPTRETLAADGYENVWDDFDAVASDHTHFAGRSRKVRNLNSGKVPLMASHDPYGAALEGVTIMLMGDGSTLSVFPDDPELNYDLESGEPIPIGDDSNHPKLQLLTR